MTAAIARPYMNATPVAKLAKIFMSPGPIYEPEGRGRDWWRTARALYALLKERYGKR